MNEPLLFGLGLFPCSGWDEIHVVKVADELSDVATHINLERIDQAGQTVLPRNINPSTMTKIALLGAAVAVAAIAASPVSMAASSAAANCNKKSLDFVYLDGDATLAAIVDDIAEDLAKVGITATPRKLVKADLNAAMQAGNFNMVVSESWGNRTSFGRLQRSSCRGGTSASPTPLPPTLQRTTPTATSRLGSLRMRPTTLSLSPSRPHSTRRPTRRALTGACLCFPTPLLPRCPSLALSRTIHSLTLSLYHSTTLPLPPSLPRQHPVRV